MEKQSIKCGLELCIYNRKKQCILRKIEINEAGMCEECILVSLDKKMLREKKEEQLRKLESRFRKTGI